MRTSWKAIYLTIINFAKNSIAFLLQEMFVKAVEFLLKRSIWVETINIADKLEKKSEFIRIFYV